MVSAHRGGIRERLRNVPRNGAGKRSVLWAWIFTYGQVSLVSFVVMLHDPDAFDPFRSFPLLSSPQELSVSRLSVPVMMNQMLPVAKPVHSYEPDVPIRQRASSIVYDSILSREPE